MKGAVRLTLSAFGAITGMAGLEHGVGELLQGNVAPEGIIIQSWPNIEVYEILAGEPAMTLIPNLLLSGVLTVIMSIIIMAWSIKFIEKKNGGRILVLLSALLLLVGGGFGPPIIGCVIGLIATRIDSPLKLVEGKSSFGKMWPVLLASSIVGYLSLWPGLVILSYYISLEGALAGQLTLVAFALLALAILSGFAYDSMMSNKMPAD